MEHAKAASDHLRGTLAEGLRSEAPGFSSDDAQVLKFHGVYQQEDRDARKERRGREAPKEHRFMVRAAIPAGILTAEQYLALDGLADRYGNGTLRVTTRQGLQFHGVLKGGLKRTIARMNEELVTTLAACGDVERNLMACPAPTAHPAHRLVQRLAAQIAAELRPASRAYHEIWLDEERVVTTEEEEPFYGDRYLPRKFKSGIALDLDNCVDVFTYDCGLVAVTGGDRVLGFNLVVGGGQGMTHSKPDTFAALGQTLGFVDTKHGAAAVKAVAALFRDHGNRSDRRHARLKYQLAEWGLERFRRELEPRLGFPLQPPRPLKTIPSQDHLGRHAQEGYHGVFVQSGRVQGALRTALRTAVEDLRPGVRFTPHQNLLLTGLDAEGQDHLESLLRLHGVPLAGDLAPARRHSMACPALPTCGLALAESERLLPQVLDRLEATLERLGLRQAPLSVRMTGCPNGCARPYTADLAFVGRSLDLYNVYVGGRLEGDRLGDLFAADVPTAGLVEAVEPLLRRWADERLGPGEALGDFYQRLRGHPERRQRLTGREEPTAPRLALALPVRP